VHLRGRDKKRLLALLDMQHSHIIEQFEKAQISLLDGRIGPTMIKTELRQLGFLL